MSTGTLGWLLQEVFRRLSRSSTKLGSPVLPAELMLMIGVYLDYPTSVSLALTCRDLYSLCWPRVRHPSKAERKELLLMLEKDVPNLFYCYACDKLHTWQAKWSWRNFRRGYQDASCPKCMWLCEHGPPVLPRLYLPSTGCNLPYHFARVAMNRYLYGPAHGFPLHRFEDGVARYYSGRRVTDIVLLHARIICGNLFLSTEHSISQSHGNPRALRDFVEDAPLDLCPHMTLMNFWRDTYPPWQLPELEKFRNSPPYFTSCRKSVRSCLFCMTDYSIDITWRNANKGYIITISTYHDLGDCRSPFEWKWNSQTDGSHLDIARSARPGAVIDAWREVDGIYEITDAKWVREPHNIFSDVLYRDVTFAPSAPTQSTQPARDEQHRGPRHRFAARRIWWHITQDLLFYWLFPGTRLFLY